MDARKIVITGATGALGRAVTATFLRTGAATRAPANRAAMPDADFDRWVNPDALAGIIRFLYSAKADIIRGALIPAGNEA